MPTWPGLAIRWSSFKVMQSRISASATSIRISMGLILAHLVVKPFSLAIITLAIAKRRAKGSAFVFCVLASFINTLAVHNRRTLPFRLIFHAFPQDDTIATFFEFLQLNKLTVETKSNRAF